MREKRVAKAALVILALLVGSCSGNMSAGYRAVYLVRSAGDETSRVLGAYGDEQAKKCKGSSSTAAEFDECIKPTKKILSKWITIVKPAINTALLATFASLETAREKKESCEWIRLIKPGLCALIAALDEWDPLIGEKLQPVKKYLNLVEGVVCK